ncbi:hypothetical protein BIW11_07118, partial [Tropilaelaps mercedesae]
MKPVLLLVALVGFAAYSASSVPIKSEVHHDDDALTARELQEVSYELQ